MFNFILKSGFLLFFGSLFHLLFHIFNWDLMNRGIFMSYVIVSVNVAYMFADQLKFTNVHVSYVGANENNTATLELKMTDKEDLNLFQNLIDSLYCVSSSLLIFNTFVATCPELLLLMNYILIVFCRSIINIILSLISKN